MKKAFIILAIILLLCLLAPSGVYAESVTILVNGGVINFDPTPLVIDGYTMVPARPFLEALGAKVSWEEKTNNAIALKDEIEIRIHAGSNIFTVNDVPVVVDLSAKIIGSRTYIPLRFTVEFLGGRVDWIEETNTINVTINDSLEEVLEGMLYNKIDLNTADYKKLTGIAGLDPEIARKIIEYRESKGPFQSYDELGNIPGICTEIIRTIKEHIKIVFNQKGIASWYGTDFHNRPTASGEIYNKNHFTAAHRYLPFGTLVKVTFLKTGKSTWVRINDRGPHRHDRIIDLSRAAAEAIGLVPYGIGEVELEVVKES